MNRRSTKTSRLKDAGPDTNARVSKGLGAADPRTHRNPQAATSPVLQLASPLRVDAKQRIGLRPARGVSDVASGADTETLVTAFNALLASLRERGIIEK